LDRKLDGILDKLTLPLALKGAPALSPNVSGSTSGEANEPSPQTGTPGDHESQQSIGHQRLWPDKFGLGTSVLDRFLQQYHEVQDYCPFVVIPEDWSAAYLLESRPFLLLAVSAAMSTQYPRLQGALGDELKDSLAKQVVVAGETSFDLLHGLVVHLTWYDSHQPSSSVC
jgi:hypothetical protein